LFEIGQGSMFGFEDVMLCHSLSTISAKCLGEVSILFIHSEEMFKWVVSDETMFKVAEMVN